MLKIFLVGMIVVGSERTSQRLPCSGSIVKGTRYLMTPWLLFGAGGKV